MSKRAKVGFPLKVQVDPQFSNGSLIFNIKDDKKFSRKRNMTRFFDDSSFSEFAINVSIFSDIVKDHALFLNLPCVRYAFKVLGKRSRSIQPETCDVFQKQKKLRIAHIDFAHISLDHCNLFFAHAFISSMTLNSVKVAKEAAHEKLPRRHENHKLELSWLSQNHGSSQMQEVGSRTFPIFYFFN